MLMKRWFQAAVVSRVLFLVDRIELAKQAKETFDDYLNGWPTVILYGGKRSLEGQIVVGTLDTIAGQLGSNGFGHAYFDLVVTDECHRSIYHLWRQVLEYFDAFIVGLTATPSKQTLGFFNQNLVMEYNHERAVADGVNVGYEVYRIKTDITEQGSKVDAGYYIDKRDRLTRKTRWEQLDDDLEYDSKLLDRGVVAPDQIRTIIQTFKEKLYTEIFPGRKEVPKTLVFAKDDTHRSNPPATVLDQPDGQRHQVYRRRPRACNRVLSGPGHTGCDSF